MNAQCNPPICSRPATILAEQLNKFTNSYAFKYPTYVNPINCNECPYELVKLEYDELSDEQKEALVKLYDDYCITPKYSTGEDITKEHKAKLISKYLDEDRTLFRREEERIIYTEAFRRLQYKTQVMVNSASDDQRTRLLHSLEVQKIARKIAIALKANYELAETIAIAHDIGHAPFGHAGENAIKKFMESHLVGSFSHALQSVKVLDFLCAHKELKPKGLKGLGISDLVLEGILKHDSDSFIDNLSLAEYKLQYNCPTLYTPVNRTNPNLYEEGEVYIGGIESQIVCWADKIAYLGHDWEEFVSIGLLEVMLSRINKIIIELDEFVNNSDDIKYHYVSSEEKNKLFELNQAYDKLKVVFSKGENSDKILKGDNFVNNLAALVYAIESFIDSNNRNDKNYILFSQEQYETLYAFFKVAYCWMIVTQKKPKKIGGKMDIIFVIYKYLNDTTSHRTVPALINGLIENSRNLLQTVENFKKDSFELIKHCNKTWHKKRADLEAKKATTKELKSELRKSFAVHFDEEYTKATEYINKFINQEFIDSTRVKFMTQKAEIIVEKLLDYYYKNYKMLPLKHRNRIEFESNETAIVENTKELLKEYYTEKINKTVKNDKENSYEAPFNFSNLRDSIIAKNSHINLDNHTLSSRATPKTVLKIMRDLLDNDDFAKDAIKLRVIADYVSGMTDRMAEKKYNEICSSGTQWSKAYSERGTFNSI